MGWGQGGLPLLFPHPAYAQSYAGPREVARMMESPDSPHSPLPLQCCGHSSSKDEISLGFFTPGSCQLAKTPDPFWNVTRPEKNAKAFGVEEGAGGGGGQGGEDSSQLPHQNQVVYLG